MSGIGTRVAAMERLAASSSEPLDLLVVGGGITGAGVALDAASRGLTVGLVEGRDFASGTSSKSSKLVHGGLRYLEQREFGLMREACMERDLLHRLAPHLVEPLPFVLPVAARAARARFGVGMWAYDALSAFHGIGFHRHVAQDEVERLVPALPSGKLKGGYVFFDCRTDDVRLVMEVLVQSCRYGATVCNYLAVRDLDGTESGCTAVAEDTVTGETVTIHARRIIVAAGVWADRVEAIARDDAEPRLRPSKGIHLIFPRDRLPVVEAAAFIPDIDRRRFLFVIPWHNSVLVGTTDTRYEGDIDRPNVEASDRAYCLDSLNRVFGLDLTDDDISGAYAGLRPLIAGKAGATADLSRRHAVYPITPGVLGITGGKLTTYRRMATDAVDHVAADLGASSKSRTKWIRLGSSDPAALGRALERRALRAGLGRDVVANLVRTYGDRSLEVMDIALNEDATAPLVEGAAPIVAEVAFTVRNEMAVSLSDLLARRTRLALTDPAAGIGDGALGATALASAHRWSSATTKKQIANHRNEVETERGLALHDRRPIAPVEERETG